MEKMFIMPDDDPAFAAHKPLTVGSVSKALADSKAALASAHELDDRLDDVDELIAKVQKSNDEFLKSFEAKDKAHSDDIAKLRAEIRGDFAKLGGEIRGGALAKMAAWEKSFFERQHAADKLAKDSGVSFDEYMARIEADREQYRRAR